MASYEALGNTKYFRGNLRIKRFFFLFIALTWINVSVSSSFLLSRADASSTAQAGLTPVLLSPSNGTRLSNLGPIQLRWENPLGTTQYHIQVIPANDDGPGIDLIIGDLAKVNSASYTVEPPVFGTGNYVMLPGMSYTWRVRTATVPLPPLGGDLLWSSWSEAWSFITPSPSSATISLVAPVEGSALSQSDTSLRWQNSASDIFYYEIQASKDAQFKTGSQAVTSIWWNLVHGGVSSQLNSWRTPLLEPNTIYYWRMRPRVQGDGTPVAWSTSWGFSTASTSVKALEHETLVRINRIRQTNNLVALNEVRELVNAAHDHSQDMATRESMSHTGSDGSDPGQRITRANYSWSAHGEIVGFGFAAASAVVDAWMNSPIHREVIMTPVFRDFGAGLVYSRDGEPYWTVNFGLRK